LVPDSVILESAAVDRSIDGRTGPGKSRGRDQMSDAGFDFDAAVLKANEALGTHPHCSCAEVTMEILATELGLPGTQAKYGAAGFGGGVAGSGGPCGAFSSGVIALGLYYGDKVQPGTCTSDLIAETIQEYYDAWLERLGSVMCADITGYPEMRAQEVRDEFFDGGGVERCTASCIKFAVEKALELAPGLLKG
jgi:C_GCAxxG_C_C family probable redox protein